MPLFTHAELADAAKLVHQQVPATPQYSWPTINKRAGCEVWVKHENHTPTGAFKVRGGVTFLHWLQQAYPDVAGIITATRGNHGQSQARSATAAGLGSKILVPNGNSKEKNTAMRAFGAEVIEHGKDFNDAVEEALRLADAENLFMVPAFHPELIRGVATYALELFSAVKELDVVYVPIGCGSGICSLITARDAMGLSTRIVGVVATEAPAAKHSFEAGYRVSSVSASTFADGAAVRVPVEGAFEIYSKGADSIVEVSEAQIAEAMRMIFHDTHNIAEGAGAMGLAALLQDENRFGKRSAFVLSGGNIDTDMFAQVLAGGVPAA
ncbi:MAG: threonine dehydratase [Granulosicoccaceae bacterium]